MATPFDFINAISFTKKDLIAEDPLVEKEYNPWMINRGLSLYPDTIMYANEMNCNYNLDKKCQNDYFLNTIRPKKRFSKWPKKVEDSDLELVKNYFKMNTAKAEAALSILSPEELKLIREKIETGGT